MKVRQAEAKNKRKHVFGAKLVSQSRSHLGTQHTQGRGLIVAKVGKVGDVSLAFDEQPSQSRSALVIGHGVVDPKAIAAADQLAGQRPLASVLEANHTLVQHGFESRSTA